MDLRIDTRVRMNDGVDIPVFGLGTYGMGSGKKARKAIRHALECGYRLLDTAAMYRNEREVGQAVQESGIPREDIFVTTKLWNSDHGYERALAAFDESLAKLGLEYVDLYLIHWPVERHRGDSWRALEAIRESGKARSIGVSNYTIRHLEELFRESSTVPAVNQVEFSPFVYQRDLLEYCGEKGIVLEAYSPLTKGRRLRDRRLAEVGERYGKTVAQVLIRWALQRGTVVIPKSSNLGRIEENAGVFDFSLSAGDMAALDALDANLRTSWDPTDAP